jgi:putative membrane protein
LRRGILAPLLSARPVRMPFAVLGRPAIATALFVGVSATWMLPSLHNLALADESVHWWMHVSLVVTGLLFFARLLDPRRPPYGAALPVRLLMCWVAILAAILIGFTVTFSPHVLYPAYEVSGLAWGVSPRLNQIYGGQTGWIPGAMMLVVALIATVYRWGRQEDRDADRRTLRADRVALDAAEFVARQRARNRVLALGLFGVSVIVLGLAVGSALVYEALRHQAQQSRQPGWHDVAR